MTKSDAVDHWQNGANESLTMAELGLESRCFSLALFHCQLAVEKALKGLYVEMHNEAPPYTHNLTELAKRIDKEWSDEDKKILSQLSEYGVKARYEDMEWEAIHATKANATEWLQLTKTILSTIL